MMENISDDERFLAIEENLKEINHNIAEAAVKSGRNPQDITFMAVTKTVDAKYIQHALDCGVNLIGENKVQELLEKEPLLKGDFKKHIIGHLQTNKVKKILTHVDMIQSVDSVHLAQEISKCSVNAGIESEILLEINIGGEESKTGFPVDGFTDSLLQIATLPGVKIMGLMTVPPICEGAELESYFDAVYKMFIDIKEKNIDNINMDILSMGMSADYETAILHGSNLVRVGSRVFGARNYR